MTVEAPPEIEAQTAGVARGAGPALPPRGRLLRGGGVVIGAAVLCVGLLAGMAAAYRYLSWPYREAAADPAFGVNFSCRHAEYLLLEEPGGPAVDRERPGRAAWCAATLGAILEATGARHVRLSVEWSDVERSDGAFTFETIDALVAAAAERRAAVLVTVGIKAQRHPEYYLPGWVLAGHTPGQGAVVAADPFVRERALRMVATVVGHLARSPAIDAWGAENEPYVPSERTGNWTLSRSFVQEVVATIRANDPRGRPVSINHAQHWVTDRRWRHALADSDVLGASMYPFRTLIVPGRDLVVSIAEIGAAGPNYAYQSREARRAGKRFWLTEMQAEPWIDGDARLASPQNPAGNLSPARFRRNLDFARRAGADRVYLWGSEWWLMQRERYGDTTWLDIARGAMVPVSP